MCLSKLIGLPSQWEPCGTFWHPDLHREGINSNNVWGVRGGRGKGGTTLTEILSRMSELLFILKYSFCVFQKELFNRDSNPHNYLYVLDTYCQKEKVHVHKLFAHAREHWISSVTKAYWGGWVVASFSGLPRTSK